MGQRKIRVAVVFGGRSTEHAVSCASAGLILSAIDRDRYEVLPIGIATDGRWVLVSGDPARLALSSGAVRTTLCRARPGPTTANGWPSCPRSIRNCRTSDAVSILAQCRTSWMN